MAESIEQREGRLWVLADAIQEKLGGGWLYVLVVGQPGAGGSMSLVSNVGALAHEEILKMLRELVRR